MTHRHHDATVRQHQAHDPHQSLIGVRDRATMIVRHPFDGPRQLLAPHHLDHVSVTTAANSAQTIDTPASSSYLCR
jgi:hypothetical protein